MTKDTIEAERRFTILEEQGKQNNIDHKTIMAALNKMNTKLDDVIQSKADKSELKIISNRMWAFVSASATALITIFVYLVTSQFR